MLPFLAYPRRYTQNAITRYWSEQVRQIDAKTPQPFRFLNKILIAIAAFPLVLPFVTPIYCLEQVLLFYLPCLALSWFMAIRTLVYSGILSHYEAKTHWESSLTGIDAYCIVLSKWWSVIQFFLRDYLIIVYLRLLTAYGFAVYFYTIFSRVCPVGLNAFCYGFPGWTMNWPPARLVVHSIDPFLTLLATVSLASFSMLELALLSALGIFSNFRTLRLRHGILFSISARATLVFISSMVLIVGSGVRNLMVDTIAQPFGYPLDFLETLQITFSPFIDSGALLSTNFLRGEVGLYNTDAFLLRNVFAVGLGMLLFVGLIWLLLSLSVRLAIRQGAMPPSREG